MSAELIGILSAGAVLAALEFSVQQSMDRCITGLEARLDERMARLEVGMVEMVGRLTAMDRCLARVEGLLLGLALSGRIDLPSAGN